MSKVVLFSPLGMSDPTRGEHDGAYIHICRIYKPQKVYLYMSKEICQYDKKDNRYSIYLEKLCDKFNFTCQVEKIKKEDLEDVSNFDLFYNDFIKILKKIRAENPDTQILLNLSSGTPQMKSALLFVSKLSNIKVTPIQVNTPIMKSNTAHIVDGDYDIELEWEFNIDNQEKEFQDRSRIVEGENLNVIIKKELIEKHIATYDYKAALEVAEDIKEYLNFKTMALIESGKCRLVLDVGNAERLARSVGYELIPYKFKKDEKGLFEFILSLSIKLKKGETADFIRGISPVLTDLFKVYLLNRNKIDVDNFCVIDKIRTVQNQILTYNKLGKYKAIYDEEYSHVGGFKDYPVTASNLMPLIREEGEIKVKDIAEKLLTVERNVRHIAAHQITEINEKLIRKQTSWKSEVGIGSEEILKMLQDLFAIAIPIPKDAWTSYDKINEKIRQTLFFIDSD